VVGHQRLADVSAGGPGKGDQPFGVLQPGPGNLAPAAVLVAQPGAREQVAKALVAGARGAQQQDAEGLLAIGLVL
jgi:hypothetical protein